MGPMTALQKLNEELGSDIKNLRKCHEINERVKAEKESIEKMVQKFVLKHTIILT